MTKMTFNDPADRFQAYRQPIKLDTTGSLIVARETYLNDVVDPRTGFTINAGQNIMLHLRDFGIDFAFMPPHERLARTVLALGQVASMIGVWCFNQPPRNILFASHSPLALMAMRVGFRRVKPDQSIFSPYFKTLLNDGRTYIKGYGISSGDNPCAQIGFLPVSELKEVYGQVGEAPSLHEMEQLHVLSKTESAQIESNSRK